MKRWWLMFVTLVWAATAAWGGTPVLIEDYEKTSSRPELWVVAIPNENASVQLLTDHPYDGKQCLRLHYHFTGPGQYLGINHSLKIHAPIHKLHFMLYGDASGAGYGLYLTDGGGETHKYRNAATMKIDFKGWKEIVIDLDAPHETWGGDRNGKIDYPVAGFTFEISTPGKAVENDLYFDAISVDSEASAEDTLNARQVSVLSPEYCSDVKGDTTVNLAAHGFKSVTVKCWKQGPGFGSDSTVATVALDARGKGSFAFPADQYPHGPITVRISGEDGTAKDSCYLQLYNKGGVSWNEGIPKDPPQAQGMALVFADDFKAALSISSTDLKATYYDHKPPNGWQDFSQHTFSSRGSPKDPFRTGRLLSANTGQRQAEKLRADLLVEERRYRDHGQGSVLLRVPLHWPQRHRHLAGLLAPDQQRGGADQGKQQGTMRRVGHHRGLRRRGAGASQFRFPLPDRPACLAATCGRADREQGIQGDQPRSHEQVRHPLHLVRDIPHLRLQDHGDRYCLLLRQRRGGPPPDASAF